MANLVDILSDIVQFLMPVYQSPYDEESLRRRTEELAHETDLSDRQCIVLAGDEMGLTDKEISLLIKSTRGSVERTRSRLRQREREHGKGERAAEAIRATYGD